MPPALLPFALVSGAALALCFTPLFNLLGYESSAAMGVVLGITAMLMTIGEVRSGRRTGPLDLRQSPIDGFFRAAPARLLLTLPPLLILGANALRVRNCDPLSGLAFWFVIPLFSALFGHGLGWLSLAVSRWPRTLGLGLIAANSAIFVYRLIVEPPIQGYHWLFGWFAGSIYDEALSLPQSLVFYRLMLATELSFGLLLLELWWRRRAHRPLGLVLQLSLLTLGAVIGLRSVAQDQGVGIDRAFIQAELGGEAESEHFTIHYDPAALSAERLALLIDDHEFRYAELRAYLRTDPVVDAGRKLRVFIYPNHRSQHRLFGSRRTYVARPWTAEMHIRWESPGETSVAHELAHLFSAPFGGGPLRLATRGGWIVDIGLVEGLALAADWPPGELDPHEAAAAMRQLDIAPDIRETFAPWGFWQQPAGKAYTLMGSFVRFLIDTYGVAAFHEAYRAGDWEQVYGKSIHALISEWEQFIDGIAVDDARLELARLRYAKGSIFHKTCARTLAELRRQAEAAEAQGDWARALQLRQEVKGHQNRDEEGDLNIAQLLVKLGRHEEALQLIDQLLAAGAPEAPDADPNEPSAAPLGGPADDENDAQQGEADPDVDADPAAEAEAEPERAPAGDAGPTTGKKRKGKKRGKRALKPAMQAHLIELRGDILWRAARTEEAAEAYGTCLSLGLEDADRRRVEVKTTGTLATDPLVTSLLFDYMIDERRRAGQLYTASKLANARPQDRLGAYLLGLQLATIGAHDEAIPWLIGPDGSLNERILDERRVDLLAESYLRIGALDEAAETWTRLLDASSSRTQAHAREGLDRVRFARGEAPIGR